jgi:hypothetical protein
MPARRERPRRTSRELHCGREPALGARARSPAARRDPPLVGQAFASGSALAVHVERRRGPLRPPRAERRAEGSFVCRARRVASAPGRGSGRARYDGALRPPPALGELTLGRRTEGGTARSRCRGRRGATRSARSRERIGGRTVGAAGAGARGARQVGGAGRPRDPSARAGVVTGLGMPPRSSPGPARGRAPVSRLRLVRSAPAGRST